MYLTFIAFITWCSCYIVLYTELCAHTLKVMHNISSDNDCSQINADGSRK